MPEHPLLQLINHLTELVRSQIKATEDLRIAEATLLNHRREWQETVDKIYKEIDSLVKDENPQISPEAIAQMGKLGGS